MSSADMLATWLQLPGVPLAELARHGVDLKAAWKVGGVRAGRAGRWILGCWLEPPSIFHVVDDDDLVLDDLLLFHPDRPDRFRCVYGSGVAMLGEGELERALFRPLANSAVRDYLRVHRHPLGWIRAGGEGCCVLDPQAFARSVIGYGDLELVGEDVEHAKAIRQTVRNAARLALPKFRVAA